MSLSNRKINFTNINKKIEEQEKYKLKIDY